VRVRCCSLVHHFCRDSHDGEAGFGRHEPRLVLTRNAGQRHARQRCQQLCQSQRFRRLWRRQRLSHGHGQKPCARCHVSRLRRRTSRVPCQQSCPNALLPRFVRLRRRAICYELGRPWRRRRRHGGISVQASVSIFAVPTSASETNKPRSGHKPQQPLLPCGRFHRRHVRKHQPWTQPSDATRSVPWRRWRRRSLGSSARAFHHGGYRPGHRS